TASRSGPRPIRRRRGAPRACESDGRAWGRLRRGDPGQVVELDCSRATTLTRVVGPVKRARARNRASVERGPGARRSARVAVSQNLSHRLWRDTLRSQMCTSGPVSLDWMAIQVWSGDASGDPVQVSEGGGAPIKSQ